MKRAWKNRLHTRERLYWWSGIMYGCIVEWMHEK